MRFLAYAQNEGRLTSMDPTGDLSQAMWIDLHNPGKADYERIKELGILIPRLRDVEQIEPSQRLKTVDDVDMITLPMTEPVEAGQENFAPVTFLITKERLVTVRYHGPEIWNGFTLNNRKTPGDVMIALLSLGVAHVADMIEQWDRALDRLTQEVFASQEQTNPGRLREIIRSAGAMGEDLSYVRLNMLILRRALVHLEEIRADGRVPVTRRQMLKRLDRDVEALTYHCDYLSGRVNLAIDATVGLISLHQNDNARVFSIIATIFLPATLIASIFGMNFEVMPWLHWLHGFEASLILMVVAAAAVVLTFVFRRWL